MDSKKLLFFSLLSFSLLPELYGVIRVSAAAGHRVRRSSQSLGGVELSAGSQPKKLFVFGDSYVDTGNHRKPAAKSWKYPYGITFPGKPTGRFSDGRVLTDYLAKYLGVKSPIPYKWRKVGFRQLKNGMNFAYGGTGVFDTFILSPNMSTQIDFLQQLIDESTYTSQDLQSSVALISLAGNDYAVYQATNGSAQGFQAFITKVVNQLEVNLRRIHGLGVPKIVVTALEPLGCLPSSTVASSFQQCNATENLLVNFHNLLLQQSVAKLNSELKNGTSSTFILLDLYSSFMAALNNKGDHLGNVKFENPLKPCCVGISNAYSCGSVDANGEKYAICEDPKAAFFWDEVHPSQQGWFAVYSALEANLKQL
ncbi:GDSL esterase/lipase At5g03610-like [Momordica charantia]|uniref:GDSL esterase/lipase At5g03610-like n=1 Tax=Momordica charantia TaxID=3673 RepID=A0A6J1CUR0_MOMCH|nr:GDSL esterase/lipase At5g03610-like [Momordica charantia]